MSCAATHVGCVHVSDLLANISISYLTGVRLLFSSIKFNSFKHSTFKFNDFKFNAFKFNAFKFNFPRTLCVR
jgi:hypothetical protein